VTKIFVLTVQVEDAPQDEIQMRAFSNLIRAKVVAASEIAEFHEQYGEGEPTPEVVWEKQEDGSLRCQYGQLIIYTIREVELQS
jgi:hypothetical protein